METKEVNEFLEAVETALVKNKKEKAQIEIKPIEKVADAEKKESKKK